jgi:hypothetical protein
MEAAVQRLLETSSRRRRPRSRGGAEGAPETEEVVRYFLAKEGSSVEKPELGVEVQAKARL